MMIWFYITLKCTENHGIDQIINKTFHTIDFKVVKQTTVPFYAYYYISQLTLMLAK